MILIQTMQISHFKVGVVRNAAYVKLPLFGKLLRLHLFSRVDLAEALRDVYRNMPFDEFSSFISFILRQLHAIRDWPSRCFLCLEATRVQPAILGLRVFEP